MQVLSGRGNVDLSQLADIVGSTTKRGKALAELVKAKEEALAEQAKVSNGQIQLQKDRKKLEADQKAFDESKALWAQKAKLEENRLTRWGADLEDKKAEFEDARKGANKVLNERELALHEREKKAKSLSSTAQAMKKKAEKALSEAEEARERADEMSADIERRLEELRGIIK